MEHSRSGRTMPPARYTAMVALTANFAASGDPSTATLAWPSFNTSSDVLSLVEPQPQLEPSFASIHHCAFWDVG